MSVISLFSIVKENFPEFDPENESDIIKAEKILKAYIKTETQFGINDIQQFLDFYRNKNSENPDLKPNIHLQKILNGENLIIDAKEIAQNEFSKEELTIFGNQYSEQIKIFLRLNLQHQNWKNLSSFLQLYEPAINIENETFLKESITEKNEICQGIITQYEKYPLLKKHYPYAFDQNYYRLQSELDVFYFEDEIKEINSSICDYQKTNEANKVVLGKILFAMSSFRAEDEELSRILQKNAKLGEKWAAKERKLDKIFDSNKIDTEKDYGPTAEWIIITFAIGLLIGISYFLFQRFPRPFIFVAILEFIVFLFFNHKLDRHFEEDSTTKGDKSIRRKMKKMVFKIYMLQFYFLVVSLLIAAFVLVVVLAISTGGFPAVIVGIIIYRFIKAKKK